MAERIDHFAEALRVLMLPTKFEDATEANALAYAQVHATLALVEQQRIANLIALSESGRASVNGARAAIDGLYSGDDGEGSARRHLRPEIKEVLGL